MITQETLQGYIMFQNKLVCLYSYYDSQIIASSNIEKVQENDNEILINQYIKYEDKCSLLVLIKSLEYHIQINVKNVGCSYFYP